MRWALRAGFVVAACWQAMAATAQTPAEIQRAAMPTARAGFGIGIISSLVYAVGGRRSTSVLATNERYTP
jgi:hypothetical protein